MSTRTIETAEFKVTFKDTPELRDTVFEAVLGFFVEHEVFAGESVMQSDAPQLEAAPLFADLADDVFKFKVTWKD